MDDLQSFDLEPWYAVHCRPFKESLAATMLAEQLGLTVYVPQIRTHFRRQTQYAPFFPRYLFIQANLQEVSISHINATAGVSRLVMFGYVPQPIPAVVIEALYHRMQQFNAQGGLLNHGFQPGDNLRLKAGPLRGLEAVFVGPMKPSERVQILVDFLGHQRPAEVNVSILEHSTAIPAPVHERRTRGKGRQIKVKG
jgi:transcriptional antiterminator RfaH